MKTKGRKKKIKLFHIIIIGLVIYVSLIFINQKKMMKEMRSKKLSLENEIESLEKDIVNLNKDIEESESLDFVEKTAREELGMVKPREIIYIDKNKFKDSILNFFRK